MQKILSWIALLGAEAIVFAAFRVWGDALPVDVRTLNLVIAMLVVALFFVDILLPWVDWSDRSGRHLGTLGIRWFVTGLYTIAAIGAMLVCNLLLDLSFVAQLLLQCVFALGLLLGFVALIGASAKIRQPHLGEETALSGRLGMVQAVRYLQNTAQEMPDLPDELRRRIDALAGELRYLSPCRTTEAAELEQRFEAAVLAVEAALPAYSQNRETIEAALARAERLCSQRKSVYAQ